MTEHKHCPEEGACIVRSEEWHGKPNTVLAVHYSWFGQAAVGQQIRHLMDVHHFTYHQAHKGIGDPETDHAVVTHTQQHVREQR